MSTKPTILLVHGGWQSPSVWTFVMPLLEKAGYSVCPVLLKSPGMAPAAFDFSCDVDAIRSSVEAVLECGKDAVVVMHSYAAIAGCEALKTFHAEMKGYAHGGDGGDGWVTSDSSAVKKDLDTKHAHRGDGDSDAVVPAKYISRRGRIVYLAFIVGMVMPVGKGLWTPERTEWDGFELKDELIRILDGPRRFYNDLPASAQKYWSGKLKLQPRPVFFSPLTYPAYRHYPCSYLMCKLDGAVPFKVQTRMAFGAGIARERIEVLEDAGHLPMISQPAKVAGFIRRAAGEGVAVAESRL
ncbi:hypothetical protein I7I51_05814 [Histoplasma capsulatum]|uniref:AB hydrolase-1 domain-containing protein n=1 Tax=Ajellomyces capsulatus TaxID=5037 RepID=A0A8A1MA00_AJECA|nr:predicted protein [Histoplasma mississippiense (nom. inval.)]EDN05207.1 predicted protein [Histoplasma mississippiense (nom. inval.)]QSS61007.1 hypothetical protein I7I51_05814 [Histoplasma capsulatum]